MRVCGLSTTLDDAIAAQRAALLLPLPDALTTAAPEMCERTTKKDGQAGKAPMVKVLDVVGDGPMAGVRPSGCGCLDACAVFTAERQVGER